MFLKIGNMGKNEVILQHRTVGEAVGYYCPEQWLTVGALQLSHAHDSLSHASSERQEASSWDGTPPGPALCPPLLV